MPIDSEKQWKIEEDVRTLSRAIEISKDKERLKAAQEYAKQQKAVLDDVQKIEDDFLDASGMNK